MKPERSTVSVCPLSGVPEHPTAAISSLPGYLMESQTRLTLRVLSVEVPVELAPCNAVVREIVDEMQTLAGSDEAQELAAQLMEFVRFHAMRASIELARTRFNDHAPLLRLHRYEGARELLLALLEP